MYTPIFAAQHSIVDTLFEKKLKELEAENENDPAFKDLGRWGFYKELYHFYESHTDAIKTNWPVHEVVGGKLNYAMSFEEIKNAIVVKFKKMKESGQIISRENFKNAGNKWLDRGTELTRIWGAEYLAKKFAEDKRKNFKVPEYLIVVDDLSHVKINIHLGACYPMISQIENGRVYAKKIDGTPVARKGSNLIGYGYTDYSDAGNILQTSDGIYYAVDTEYKSFYDGLPESHLMKGVKGGPLIACEYFQNRFKYINKIDKFDKMVEFSLS